jgi:hypothetical protein
MLRAHRPFSHRCGHFDDAAQTSAQANVTPVKNDDVITQQSAHVSQSTRMPV